MVFGKKMKAGSKRLRRPKANAGHSPGQKGFKGHINHGNTANILKSRMQGPGCSNPLPTASSLGRKLLTLAHAVPGKKYRIVRVEGECKLSSRLCAMGLMPNELLSVYTASRGGPAIIAVKGSRFAIGRGMTNRIIIEET
jgi:ferrous iron transport protein A